jgi:D-3-phosphoglycerate dehydrogenase
MHIVIPDDYQDAVRRLACFAMLSSHTVTVYNDTVTGTAALAARFQDADALVLIRERTRIDEALLARLPRLKLISQTGRGINHINLEACTRHGVAVAVGTGSPDAPAELTWALIMAAMRQIPAEAAALRAGRWQASPRLGRALKGRTLGIYGYGQIGALVAGYGRAFGMRVLIWGRGGSFARAAADSYTIAADRTAFFAESDVLSVHVKLNPQTRGLITAADLAAMKPDALFVNTSRAELIEPGALLAALRAGRPGGAALDVFDTEPAIGDPLVQLDQVLATPHLGYVEQDSYAFYFGVAFDNLLAFAAGRPVNVLNPAVLG